jgi:Dcp1-like decapping family
VQDLTADFEFELSKPYLLYRTENEVNGLWFYEDGDGQKMTDMFTRCAPPRVRSLAATASRSPPLQPHLKPIQAEAARAARAAASPGSPRGRGHRPPPAHGAAAAGARAC